MRIFYDMEFVERGRDLPLRLVSVGMVCDDGRELYLINEECLSDVARHPWLSFNVLPHLPAKGTIAGGILEWDREHADYERVLPLDTLVTFVREFMVETRDLELWAYYGAYDHVVLCQLFGSMAELPSGIPMWTHELMQEWERAGRPTLPPMIGEHNAINDARWARDLHVELTRIAEEQVKVASPQ